MSIVSYLLRICYKLFAVVIRIIATHGMRLRAVKPDDVYQLPSRDSNRSIKAHVYRPTTATTPSPVLVNLHGSGFVIPMHGTDHEFCRKISRETDYTVLDIQYRLAPEHPFPAALHDAEDAVTWVLQHPEHFDLSHVAISGFSAGGNLALAASSSGFPRETFRSVLAFYPVTDLYTNPRLKMAPDPNGKPIPAVIARFFNRCYIPSAIDARDPRISPSYAAPEHFPDRLLLVTAAGDDLAREAEVLAAQISKEPGREVVSQRMQGCNHAWDKKAPAGSVAGDAKDKAYDMAVAMLSR